jgi:hypothetical protein
MAKVCKSGGEGTFAERHGNGEVAPKAAIPLEPAKPLSSAPCRHVQPDFCTINSLESMGTSDGCERLCRVRIADSFLIAIQRHGRHASARRRRSCGAENKE